MTAPALQDMAHAGWGDPARRTGLPPRALAWLRRETGVGPQERPVPEADLVLPPSRLTEQQRAALAALAQVRVDDRARVRCAAGRSYLDLLRLRRGALTPPDAVVLPADATEVGAVLRRCAELGIAVVPFGGGTSVVGGVRPEPGPHRAVLALDLRRMDRLVSVDPLSLTAVFEPGVRGPDAERLLAPHGLTLGHVPQSFELATLGGYAATRSAGQASTGYGRFDDLVLALRAETPAGPLVLGRGAASAAGPDLRALLVGSEGAFGVLTELTLRVRPLPEVRRYDGLVFRSWRDGTAALRALEQQGLAPDVARLSDPDETRVQLALSATGLSGAALRGYLTSRGAGRGCLAVLGWEGTARTVARRRSEAGRHLRTALRLPGAGERWEHGRYGGPYLRDDLLDAGLLVETLETSATWTDLDRVRSAVRSALWTALGGTPPVVMCHVSHLYPHGASLYFTVLTRRDAADPEAQWQRAKEAATRALMEAGGTLTHHHAVGTDHAGHLHEEVGDLGVEVLRAVKGVLDPTGVLNPGKLLP